MCDKTFKNPQLKDIAVLERCSDDVLMSSLWSERWVAFVDSTNLSDQIFFVLATSLLNFALFWAHNLLLFVMYKVKFLKRYQIQPDAEVDVPLVWENIRETLIAQVVGVPLAAYVLFQPFSYMGMSVRGPIPPYSVVFRDLLVAAAVTDTMGYWGHRALHHKSVYKYFHKKHHRYTVNVGIAAVFAHPVEDTFHNTFSSIAGCLLMGTHALVFWLWVVIRQTESINAHSGYQFLPNFISKWCSGGRFHEYHHSHNVGNYGALTTIWDHLMGTDVSFLEYEQKRLAKDAAHPKSS